MGKIIQNCPCCVRGVCTCCCSSAIGKKLTVTFEVTDSNDGNGGSVTCCLNGVSVELTYTPNTVTNENLWLGEIEGACDNTIWVAANCPVGGRYLLIAVSCGESRPALFAQYEFFSGNVGIQPHDHPAKYGFGFAKVDSFTPDSTTLPVLGTPKFKLDNPEEPFDEEGWFKLDEELATTSYVKVPDADTAKIWHANEFWIFSGDPPVSVGEVATGTFLFKNTNVSDVHMTTNLRDNYWNAGFGFVLRKNDNGFIWFNYQVYSGAWLWQVENIGEGEEVQTTWLGGINNFSPGFGLWEQTGSWGGSLHVGAAKLGILTNAYQTNAIVELIADGNRIMCFFGGHKVIDVVCEFNRDATIHGLAGSRSPYFNHFGAAHFDWAIWNMPVDIDRLDGCETGTTLSFEGNIYSGYNERWPSQSVESCCSVPPEVGAYINIGITATSNLATRECNNDCVSPICDDCQYSPCVPSSDIELTCSGFTLAGATDYYKIANGVDAVFNTTFTLRKLSYLDTIYFPAWDGNGLGTFYARTQSQNVPFVGDGCGADCYATVQPTFRDGMPNLGGINVDYVLGCVWMSDYFDVQLAPEAGVITALLTTDNLDANALARSTLTRYRWELQLVGGGGGTFLINLYLREERELRVNSATLTYAVWVGTFTGNDCDGPWTLTPHPNTSPGPHTWLETPATITAQPILPTNSTTLNESCPHCCDGEATVGRDLVLILDDTNDDTNDIAIQLTMSTYFGQCVPNYPYEGAAFFQWESQEWNILDHPEIAGLGAAATFSATLQCRWHRTSSGAECPGQVGFNCLDTWRRTGCGHFDWCLYLTVDGVSYMYTNDLTFSAANFSPTAGNDALEASCDPFYISGTVKGLGPYAVERELMINGL